jgi:hypothetical protein
MVFWSRSCRVQASIEQHFYCRLDLPFLAKSWLAFLERFWLEWRMAALIERASNEATKTASAILVMSSW